MRFSLATVAAALPALAVAQEGMLDQAMGRLQVMFNGIGAKLHFGIHDPVAALEAKLGSMKLHVLTKDNWRETLYEPVPANAVKPVEWWVLFSGRNQSCSST